jgi:peptidoglycan/LPS O-acetylase OafA/YrhL
MTTTSSLTATPAEAPETAQHRFLLLDGLRGVAAFAIIVDHVPTGTMAAMFPGRYLAVDFFFMLSGFVLAHAYGKRLAEGWSPWTFMYVRIARLYPLYLAALGLSLALALLGALRGWHCASAQEILYILPFALLFLPSPIVTQWAGATLYPFNGPSWSLFYELIANFVYALIARFLNTKVLAGILIASGAFLIFAIFRHAEAGISWHWGVWDLGLARSLFGFFGGVALYRISHHIKLPAWPAPIAALAVIALVMFPAPGVWRHVFDVAASFVFIPLIIMLSANANLTGATAKLCAGLGWLSYGVYVLQVPTLSYVRVVFAMFGQPDMPTSPWTAVLVALLMAAVSAAFTLAWDTPVRRFLTRAIRRKPGLAASANVN